MKKLLIIMTLITISSGSGYALPGFSKSMSTCEISYYHFCDELGDSTSNMCPENLMAEHKDICIVNETQKIDLLNSCSSELKKFCGNVRKKEFLFSYTCLAQPKLWSSFSKNCLSAISGAHTHNPEENKI